MLPELRYELLFFYTRNELEHLQPLSQSLLGMIVAGANVLPLRPIYCVDMDCYDAGVYNIDKIHIFVEEPADDNEPEPVPDYAASVHDGDFKEIVLRLQNTCIKDFNVGIRDSPFLRYWKAQEATFFTVVSVYFDAAEAKDYDVLDSIMSHLRPKAIPDDLFQVDGSWWQENGDNGEKLQLLARASFLKNLQTCRLAIFDAGFPPPSFFLKESGYSNYELWCFYSNVVDGIDRLIESFVSDGCANARLESVYVQWTDDAGPARMPKQLSKSTKIDVPLPLPKIEMTMSMLPDVHRVTKCEKRSFVNAMQWKRMDVIKWTVEYGRRACRITAHILQCLVKDL